VKQLTITGEEVEFPRRPKRLTWRQRQLVLYLKAHGPRRAGQIPTHANPWGALHRLEALGLVRHGMDGRWSA